MANVINKISNEMKEKIKKKSILTAPNNPTERGMSPTTIKKLLTDPVVADKDSIISEINRIVDEINLYVKFSESSDADYAEFIGFINEVKNDINTNKTDISTLKSSVSSLINTVSSFSGKINENTSSIQTIYGLIDSLQTRINQLQQSINGTDSDVANLEDRLDKLEDGLADSVIELTNYVTKEEFNVVANASQDNAEKLKKVYTIEEVDIEVNDLRQETENYYVKKTDQRIKSVDYNIQTGIFTFTKQDGTIFEVDLAIEKVVTNFVYNKQTNALELTLADGTVQSIPMSDFASAYEGVENDQIQVSIQSGNKIQAILKDGSININHLNSKFASDVGVMVTTVSELANRTQDNAEAIANRYTKQETSDLIDAEVGDAKEELKNVYLKKSNDPVTDDGQIVIVNVDGSTSYSTETLYEIANRISNLEQNQGSGGSGSGGTVFETQQIDIAVSDWTELPDSEPYTYFANVTLSNPLDNAISIELINNNPILFAKYGFAIGEITAMDELEIYSIGKPNDSVTLTFETVSQTSSVNLISFTIDGTSYSAEEGMTWSEWCNSEYNTIGASANSNAGYIIDKNYMNTIHTVSSSVEVLPSDTIVNGENYEFKYAGGGN